VPADSTTIQVSVLPVQVLVLHAKLHPVHAFPVTTEHISTATPVALTAMELQVPTLIRILGLALLASPTAVLALSQLPTALLVRLPTFLLVPTYALKTALRGRPNSTIRLAPAIILPV
jgi:hypothetical protein